MLNNCTTGFSVSAEVRARIMKAVQSLGYVSNLVGRTLGAKRTMLVQVVNQPSPTMHPSGDAVIALGTCIYFLQKSGFSVVARFVRHETAPTTGLPDFRVDGALLVGVGHAREVKALDEHDTPYVVINGDCGSRGACVKVDERRGMELAIDHLVGLGHARIAYIGASHALGRKYDLEHYSVAARRAAYAEILRERGLTPVPGWQRNHDGAGAIAQQMHDRHRVTAVVAYDHLVAIELLQQLRGTALVVPRDLSVVCFNDHPPTEHVTPALSAIHQPYGRMGHEAAGLLLRMISGEGEDVRGSAVTLQPSLTIRQSSTRA